MKFQKKCYCILILITLLFSLCSCSNSDKKNNVTNNSNNTNLNSDALNNKDENSSSGTDTEPLPDESVPIGTRNNPLPFNTTVLYNGSDTLYDMYTAELTLLDIVRGPDALAIAKSSNQYNSTPSEGKEYLFAKFRVRALTSDNDAMIDINKIGRAHV